jgi:hypothetical protein
MEALPQTAENEELVIDTIEGLVDFFAYAQDAFADFKESVAICPSEEVCAPYLRQAEDAYEEIQSLVERHCKVLDLGGFLTEDDAEEIQALYNKIVSAQDDLERAMSGETIEEVSPLVDQHRPHTSLENVALLESEDSEDDTTYAEEPQSVFVTQAQGSLQVTDETESVSSPVKIRQSSIDSETFRGNLHSLQGKAETLLVQGEAMLYEYQEMSESTEDDDNFRNGVALYQQLKTSTDSLKNISAAITARAQSPVTEDAEVFLHQVTDPVYQFEKKFALIDTGLALFFEDSESAMRGVNSSEEFYKNSEFKVTDGSHFEAYRPNLFSKNEMRPAIERVVAIPEYKKFLSEYFSSPGAFEAYLRREVTLREKISKFDSVFGIVRKSPFDTLLRDMTLKELEVFDHQPSESLRHELLHKDIQYEMYVDWMHEYEAMKEMVRTTPTMKFGELYVRAMVEDLMDKQLAHAA